MDKLQIRTSIPAMHSFIRGLVPTPSMGLRELFFAQRIAGFIGEDVVVHECALAASELPVDTDYEFALRWLMQDTLQYKVAMPAMAARGAEGWFLAANVAERAYIAGDIAVIEQAVSRMADYRGERPAGVDVAWEIVWAQMMLGHAKTGEWDLDRGVPAVQALEGYYQQGALIDWGRLGLRVQFRLSQA